MNKLEFLKYCDSQKRLKNIDYYRKYLLNHCDNNNYYVDKSNKEAIGLLKNDLGFINKDFNYLSWINKHLIYSGKNIIYKITSGDLKGLSCVMNPITWLTVFKDLGIETY